MGWTAILIAALAAAVVTLALAVVRQRLLLRSLADGLTALRSDRLSVRAPAAGKLAWLGRLLREPADAGAGAAFDRLAERLEQRRFEANLAPRAANDEVGPALVGLLDGIVPPLRTFGLSLAAARDDALERHAALADLSRLLDRLDRRRRLVRDSSALKRGLSGLLRLADEAPDTRPRLRPLTPDDAPRLELPLALVGVCLEPPPAEDDERTAIPSGLPPVMDVSADRADSWETLARRHPALGYPPSGVLLVRRGLGDRWRWLRIRDALPLDPDQFDAELIAAWRANEPGREVSVHLPAAWADLAGAVAERLARLGCRVVPASDAVARPSSAGLLSIQPSRGATTPGSSDRPGRPMAGAALVLLIPENGEPADHGSLFDELAARTGSGDLAELGETLLNA
jgi:hypothetical protein